MIKAFLWVALAATSFVELFLQESCAASHTSVSRTYPASHGKSLPPPTQTPDQTPPQNSRWQQTLHQGTIAIKGQLFFNALMGEKSLGVWQKYAGNALSASPLRTNETMFSVDKSKIEITLENKHDHTDYGFCLSFSGDKQAKSFLKESYGFVKNPSKGTVFAGNTSDVICKINVDGSNVQVATGGVGGIYRNMEPALYGVSPSFSLAPHGGTDVGTKISFITPSFSGLQLGLSYTPDSTHTGAKALGGVERETGTPFHQQALSAALKWCVNFSQSSDAVFSLGLLSSETGLKAVEGVEKFSCHPTWSWTAGGRLNLHNRFSFAFGCIDQGVSGKLKTDHSVDPLSDSLPVVRYVAKNATGAFIWNAGLRVGLTSDNKTKASLGYLESSRHTGFQNHKATAQVVSLGVERMALDKISVYAEYIHETLKNNASLYEAKLCHRFKGKDLSFVSSPSKQQNNIAIVGVKFVF